MNNLKSVIVNSRIVYVLLLAIMTDFGVAPLAGRGQIVIYIVQPCGTILKPGQRANGGTHTAFISCEIQWHQILNTSLWSAACLVPQSSHLNLQQPGENKEKRNMR